MLWGIARNFHDFRFGHPSGMMGVVEKKTSRGSSDRVFLVWFSLKICLFLSLYGGNDPIWPKNKQLGGSTNMSPENPRLEAAFPTEIVPKIGDLRHLPGSPSTCRCCTRWPWKAAVVYLASTKNTEEQRTERHTVNKECMEWHGMKWWHCKKTCWWNSSQKGRCEMINCYFEPPRISVHYIELFRLPSLHHAKSSWISVHSTM